MSETNESMQKISKHREQIDQLDKQIVSLLNERASHSLAIRALKPGARMGLYDPAREEEIFQRIESFNEGPIYNDNLREIYRAILKVMKEIPA